LNLEKIKTVIEYTKIWATEILVLKAYIA